MAEKVSHSAVPKFYADLCTSWRSGMKKMVASYIDTSEKMAKGVLEFQEKATSWAKETPWAPFFEAQHAIAARWIEGSADIARKLWQIEEEAVPQG